MSLESNFINFGVSEFVQLTCPKAYKKQQPARAVVRNIVYVIINKQGFVLMLPAFPSHPLDNSLALL